MKIYLKKVKPTDQFIRECLNDYFNNNDYYEIIRTKTGKPLIEDNDIIISVSHSEEYIALAISESKVGIDIEKIVTRDYIKLAERYFSEQEAAEIKDKGLECFYKHWTTKEAYTKLKGATLNLRISEDEITREGYNISHQIIDGYFMTVISEGESIL